MNIKNLIYITTMFLVFNNAYTKTGKEIFDMYCTTCHSPQMASMFQAPAAHNQTDWDYRKENASLKIDKNSIKNDNTIINILTQNAIEGTEKGMPPKGTCMDCSNEELKNAIMYMISKN